MKLDESLVDGNEGMQIDESSAHEDEDMESQDEEDANEDAILLARMDKTAIHAAASSSLTTRPTSPTAPTPPPHPAR